jgi:hypothetical protein
MKLRFTLLLFCLFCIGIFSQAQQKPPIPPKPKVENGPDAIPVTVTSHKKAKKPLPPPPPPPKAEAVKFTPPKIVKDAEKAPVPPTKTEKPPKVPIA